MTRARARSFKEPVTGHKEIPPAIGGLEFCTGSLPEQPLPLPLPLPDTLDFAGRWLPRMASLGTYRAHRGEGVKVIGL